MSLLASEWTKLRSLASTWWCAGVYAVVVLPLGLLGAAITDDAPRADFAVAVALTGFGFGQLVLVVLGVLTGAGEFTSGSAVSSFTAVPRRTRLLLAKTAVVALFAAALTVLLEVGCVFAARTLTTVPGGVPLLDPGVLRALGLQVACAALVVVLSVALGTALRSSAGGIGLGTALVFLLPPILAAEGGRVTAWLSQALPALRVGEDAFLAGAAAWPLGVAVLAVWGVGAWALAAVLLERRDV
ncbi:ABC transporter permease [Geodermatophilus sp. SYSU D00815]